MDLISGGKMKQEYKNFTIEYSNDDLEYIDDFIQKLLNSQDEIMSFFHLESLDRKVEIKLWNGVHEYEEYLKSEIKRVFKRIIELPKWQTGISIITKNESQIHMLSYSERLKRKGHSQDTVESIIKVIIHEFVHTCHAQYKKYKATPTWIDEALATVLSHQYDNENLRLGCTLEDFLNGRVDYLTYYTLGRYLFENHEKDDILKLASNRDLVIQMAPDIFQNAKEWVPKKYDNLPLKNND